ncbi:MAG: hypothetical protein U1F65_02160 [Verrucomicrobiota bacterium]
MKLSIARICLGVGLILFFSGFFVLCDCPGWFALAAGFIGVSALLGAGKSREWAIVWFFAALLVTGMEVYAKFRHKEKKRELLQKMVERERAMASTNKPSSESIQVLNIQSNQPEQTR